MALFTHSNSLHQTVVSDLGRCGLPYNYQMGFVSLAEAAVHAGNRLLAAAAMGEVGQAARCLADGADCNFQDASSGESALHRAAQRNQVPVLGPLLTAGADIHLRDRGQRTPLFVAANEGHLESVYKLLSHGAQLFPDRPCRDIARDSSTCAGGARPVAPHAQPNKLQGEADDDDAFLDLRSTCPLATAAAAARWPVVAALLAGLPNDYQDIPAALRSMRFLIWALASHKAFPREVIARMPPRLPHCVIDAVRPAYLASTPLVLATGNDQQQLMQWLLKQGADPELGAPLLLCAGRFCHGSRTCCVNTLLRRGAGPHVAWADNPADSPLQLAARGDCFTHVHVLVAYGADVGGEAARVREALYSPAPWEANLDALLQQHGTAASAPVAEAEAQCSRQQHARFPGLWPVEGEEVGCEVEGEELEGEEAAPGAGGNSCNNRMASDDAWYLHNKAEMEQLQDGAELADSRKAVDDLWLYGCGVVAAELGGTPAAPHSFMPHRVLSALKDLAAGWLAAAARCRQQRLLRVHLYDHAVTAGRAMLDRKRVAALAALCGARPACGDGPVGLQHEPRECCAGASVGGEAKEPRAPRPPPAAAAEGLAAELRMEILVLTGLAPPGVKAQTVLAPPRGSCKCAGCSS